MVILCLNSPAVLKKPFFYFHRVRPWYAVLVNIYRRTVPREFFCAFSSDAQKTCNVAIPLYYFYFIHCCTFYAALALFLVCSSPYRISCAALSHTA